MRIENEIYFAPGIKFKDLVWDDPSKLLEPFYLRVKGFYLDQAGQFVQSWNDQINQPGCKIELLSGLAFGCGVICSTAIDFLASIENFPNQDVGDRYKKWLNERIPIFLDPDPQRPKQTISARFYYEFRNGLVHEGRIKNAGQFSFDGDSFPTNGLVEIIEEAMVVNPSVLLNYIGDGLDNYLHETEGDKFLLQKYRCTIINYFSADMEHIKKYG